MGNTNTMSDKRVWKDWIEDNPLRTFRKEREITVMEAATRLHISLSMIQMWERGVHFPSPENMAKIVAFTEDPEIEQRWVTWKNSQPE